MKDNSKFKITLVHSMPVRAILCVQATPCLHNQSKVVDVYNGLTLLLVCDASASCCSPRNGGRPCIGVHTRYKTCNTHKCTAGHVDVQKQNQCQARNSQWTALLSGGYPHDTDTCIRTYVTTCVRTYNAHTSLMFCHVTA